MDDTQDFLSDLLECSVCFEQLDIHSKVLPCQHTFCKSCLEGIVTTHKELRCPECRVLVNVASVDELPPNILLIRLLEGIKNNSKLSGSVRTPRTPSAQPEHFLLANQTPIHVRRYQPQPDGHQRQPLQQQADNVQRSTVVPKQLLPAPNLPRARALFNFEAKEECDLSFKKGDIILLRKSIDANWLQGELNGQVGFLPSNYVQIITPLPIPQCKALYDFRVTESDEKDCLTFSKFDVITVLRRVDDNWAEGKLDDRVGIFPISFVEMNSSAKALMKLSSYSANHGTSRTAPPTPGLEQPTSANEIIVPVVNVAANESTVSSGTSTSSPTPLAVTRSPTSVASSSMSAAGPAVAAALEASAKQQAVRLLGTTASNGTTNGSLAPVSQIPILATASEGGQFISNNGQPAAVMAGNYNKRHSLCAPSSNNGIGFALAVNHQRSNSHQIDDSVSHRRSMEILSDRNGTGAPDVVSSTNWTPIELARNSTTRSCRLETSLMGTPRTAVVYSRPLPVPTCYVALFDYAPQKSDELELRKNELYTVVEKCQDGWFKGSSIRTGAVGVFPGNYVQISKSSLPQLSLSAHPLGNGSSSEQSPASVAATQQHHHQKQFDSTPPPLRPKPAAISSSSSSGGPASTIYARPSTLVSSVHSSLLDWAQRNLGQPPPSRQPKSRSSSNGPSRDLSPTESTSTGSTPSPDQWHPVRVAATRNTPPVNHNASVIPSGSSGNESTDRKTEANTKEKRISLMKRWTKKKSKSPPPNTSYAAYHDNPTFVDTPSPPNVILANPGSSLPSIHHVRSGSCPSEALGGDSGHRNESVRKQPAVAPFLMRERYRCIVPYPPNSEYELPLEVGDIVFVHKRREDGWFKGTLKKSGRTGLFPGSFVAKIE